MRVFFKAVITGFGLSVGKALYDMVSERVGMQKQSRDGQPDPVDPTADGDVVRKPT
jgi:hypothetical protein